MNGRKDEFACRPSSATPASGAGPARRQGAALLCTLGQPLCVLESVGSAVVGRSGISCQSTHFD